MNSRENFFPLSVSVSVIKQAFIHNNKVIHNVLQSLTHGEHYRKYFQIDVLIEMINTKEDDNLWDDDGDDDILAEAADDVEKSILEFHDDDDDDLLVAVEDCESASEVELKDKADEDSYEALGVSPPSASEERCLKDQFGLTKFKPLQWKIVRSVMVDRKDQAVIMSTGYGKSLTYQLFRTMYEDKTVIVVSPLISLMEDHVLPLQSNGSSVALMGSAQSRTSEVLRQLEDG